MTHLTQIIRDGLLHAFKFPELVTVLISILPIVEGRGGVLVASGYFSPFFAFLFAFIGSSLMAPILIALLLPFVRWLSRTRFFRRIGQTIYEKFEQKSKSIAKTENDAPETNDANEKPETADDIKANKRLQAKKFWGVFAFVAIPLPLTGVWTGSAVAAITRLKYPFALAAVVLGNMVACAIMTLLCFFFKKWIDVITIVIGVIAIAVVIMLIIKIILHKPKSENEIATEQIEEEKK